MATKYWRLGEGFYWETDGERTSSMFLYIGNDRRFWHQVYFNTFVEIKEVFDAETGAPADRSRLFNDACADNAEFSSHFYEEEWNGEGKRIWQWEAQGHGGQMVPVLLVN